MIRGRRSIAIILLLISAPSVVRAQFPKPDDVSESAWNEILKHAPDAGNRDMNAAEVYKYSLRNASPANVAEILKLIYIGTGGGRPPVPGIRPLIAPNTPAVESSISPELLTNAGELVGKVYCVPDAPNNSVLIATTPNAWASVKAVLDYLDRPRQQIMLKAIFAEVTHDDSAEAEAFFSALNEKNLFPQTGSKGVLSITPATLEISTAFQKMDDRGKIKILSRPFVLGKDGQRSFLGVGNTEQGPDPNYTGDAAASFFIIPWVAVNGQIVLNLTADMYRPGEKILSLANLELPGAASRYTSWHFAVDGGHAVIVRGFPHRHEATQSNVELIGMITPSLPRMPKP